MPLGTGARVLDDLRTEKKSPYLFINTKTGNRLTTISKVWDRIRQQAGMPAPLASLAMKRR